MSEFFQAVSPHTVILPRPAARAMIGLARSLHRLSHLEAYRQRILPRLPEVARFDPGHDAVMMGYDFHLSPTGPKLIEVNTNAGGGLLAWAAQAGGAQGQFRLSEALEAGLLATFAQEMRAFSGGRQARPRRIAIVDEDPQAQFLFPEMEVFRELFERRGIQAAIVDAAQLQAGEDGVFLEGERVDLLYNRHCDFYLETPVMVGIRAAYLARAVCLTPNPLAYGLLADKRRMIQWSDPEFLAQLNLDRRSREALEACVLPSHLLADLDREEVWAQRKQWAFKPVSRFGSRGVYLGRKISHSTFDQLPGAETLVQQLVPPSVSAEMKVDLRLYVYREMVLGVGARLYQGQVTNLRTPGGGFARIRLA